MTPTSTPTKSRSPPTVSRLSAPPQASPLVSYLTGMDRVDVDSKHPDITTEVASHTRPASLYLMDEGDADEENIDPSLCAKASSLKNVRESSRGSVAARVAAKLASSLRPKRPHNETTESISIREKEKSIRLRHAATMASTSSATLHMPLSDFSDAKDVSSSALTQSRHTKNDVTPGRQKKKMTSTELLIPVLGSKRSSVHKYDGSPDAKTRIIAIDPCLSPASLASVEMELVNDIRTENEDEPREQPSNSPNGTMTTADERSGLPHVTSVDVSADEENPLSTHRQAGASMFSPPKRRAIQLGPRPEKASSFTASLFPLASLRMEKEIMPPPPPPALCVGPLATPRLSSIFDSSTEVLFSNGDNARSGPPKTPSSCYSAPFVSSSHQATPLSSGAATFSGYAFSGVTYQSPHWSKGVAINPFSPVPPEYIMELPPLNNAGSPPRLSSIRDAYSPVCYGSPPKDANVKSFSICRKATTSFSVDEIIHDDETPLDVEHFPSAHHCHSASATTRRSPPLQPLQSPCPPMTPAKSSAARSRRFYDVEEEGGDNFGETYHVAPYTVVKRRGHESPKLSPQPCSSPSPPRGSQSTSETLYSNGFQSLNSQNFVPYSRFEDDFQSVGSLGTGSFGTVYKCISRLDGCLYAVKVIKRAARGELDRQHMLKEVHALAALCSRADSATFHIVRYHQAWMEENRLYIQTELCTSTLPQEVQNGVLRDGARRLKLLREILLALNLIHQNDMVHLDIKPDNIFVKDNMYKLGDFGLASKVNSYNSDAEEGDARYMSKEMLSGDNKDLKKCDIFSLGATMCEICLERPLPADGEDWQELRSGRTLNLPYTSPVLQKLISEMMHPDPQHRPSAIELLQRPPLLSEEQRELMMHKNKAREATMALAVNEMKLRYDWVGPQPPKRSRSISSFVI